MTSELQCERSFRLSLLPNTPVKYQAVEFFRPSLKPFTSIEHPYKLLRQLMRPAICIRNADKLSPQLHGWGSQDRY